MSDKQKTIVCYGDSNTYGQNYRSSRDPSQPFRLDFDQRWTGILSQMLAGKARVAEEGLSGRTTAWSNPVEPYRNGKEVLPPVLMSHAPVDLLIIMLGSNDLRGIYTAIPFNLQGTMSSLLATATSPQWQIAGGHMQTLLVAPPHLKDSHGDSPWPGLTPDKNVPLCKDMVRIYKKLAAQYHVAFLDANQYAEVSDEDFTHMTPENHRKLAHAIYDKVTEMLDL